MPWSDHENVQVNLGIHSLHTLQWHIFTVWHRLYSKMYHMVKYARLSVNFIKNKLDFLPSDVYIISFQQKSMHYHIYPKFWGN